MLNYGIVFLIALGLTFVLTPLAAVLGRRLHWVDVPSELSIHTLPIPRTGGLAMVAAFVAAVAFSYFGQLLRPADAHA